MIAGVFIVYFCTMSMCAYCNMVVSCQSCSLHVPFLLIDVEGPVERQAAVPDGCKQISVNRSSGFTTHMIRSLV